MEWLADNWGWLIPITISVASVIVKVTPNETDNKVLEGFIKIFEKLALNTNPVTKKNGKK